jgi:hypothetical protein
MTGVHIEAVGINKWKLIGEHTVYLRMEESLNPISVKWVVENGAVIARYSTCGVALGHAYQIAKGHTPRQAEAY